MQIVLLERGVTLLELLGDGAASDSSLVQFLLKSCLLLESCLDQFRASSSKAPCTSCLALSSLASPWLHSLSVSAILYVATGAALRRLPVGLGAPPLVGAFADGFSTRSAVQPVWSSGLITPRPFAPVATCR